MRIAVTHVYSSKNKGDAAILLCQLQELARAFPAAQFDVMTLARSLEERDFEGRVVQRSLMSRVVGGGAPRPLRPLLGASMMGYTTLWAVAKRRGIRLPLPAAWREPMQTLDACDAQVCVGGGYLRGVESAHSTYLLTLLVHQIALGYLLDKPVYLYAQSFGPFFGKAQEQLFRLACACSALVLPRESISNQVALRAVDQPGKVQQVIDTAFLIEPASPADLSGYFPQGKPAKVVGITARAWLSDEGQARYEAALASFIAYLVARNVGVLIIPQVTAQEHGDDDRLVGQRLKRRFHGEPRVAAVEEDLPIRTVLSLYAALDTLVGTRFHSVIFCLCANVPCLAIEYEHKTSGILRDLGLEEWCMRIDEVSGDMLVERFQRLEGQRKQVRRKLKAAVASAREQARAGGTAIAVHFAGQERQLASVSAAPKVARGALAAQAAPEL